MYKKIKALLRTITNASIMSSTTKNTSAFSKFFAEHHNIMLKRNIMLTGDDTTLESKKDKTTVLSTIRDFFKTHQRVMIKRGVIAAPPGDGTFDENGATKHKEGGVLVAETSEKIQDA
ncbi:hypothetical protein ATCVNEJV2_335R [Acanthocystis turfacea Chlorella virus NE-JV-2]|nr:hypothetical protein ATCVNEJV2_335R [Acanthocystis turfacea Chlorella virus NE-JV-2]